MSSSNQRILIVEDDPDGRADLRQMLLSGSDRKYEFFEAELGLSALALMQENENSPFDCVLLEYHLPDMDAPEVLVSLCNGKDMPPCPVVVITGSDRKAGPTLLRAGAQDYLGKSWLSADSLTRAIDNAIERFAMLRERVKSEKSLRESEEQFRTLLESAPDAMVIVDQEGKIFLVNAEAERIFGYSRLELLGANVEMLIPARSQHRHVEQRATYLEHPKTRAMNAGPAMLGLRKDGTEFPIEVSLSPLKTAAGLLISSSIRDVTERLADKNSIQEGASRLALAVKVSGLAIAEIDYATGMNHLSADAARLFGLGEVAMTVPRASVHATFHPDDIPELLRRITESLSPTGEGWFAMDHRVIWPNGEVHWLRVRKQVFFEGEGVDKHPAHAMLASFDVTAEKNASEIVRAGGEFVRGVLDSLPEHVVVLDDLSNILAVNKPWDLLAVENGGALDASSVGLNYLDLCRNSVAKGAPHVMATIEGLEEVLNGSRLEFRAEYSCPAPGKDQWYSMHAKRMRYGNSGVVVSHVDITEKRRARAKLEDSETRFRRLFEAAHDGILILDASTHKITHVNPFLTTLLDYRAEHFLGRELWEIGFLKDKQASVSAMQQLDELGSIRYESLPLEDRHGMKHPVEMVANKYEEGHHPVIQCNIRDISERRRLEKQMLAQASELSDLHRRKDEFLAMLSHELRSPLAPIANAVQLLGLQKSSENRTQQQARGIIERQVGQLQHLVDDLLEVSRITTGRVQLRLERIAMCQIAEGAVETVRPLIEQRRHELTVTLPSEPVWMIADAARLEQVLVNLLTNASKYTEGGGHIWLTVEVEVVASDEGRVVRENNGEGRVTRGEREKSGEGRVMRGEKENSGEGRVMSGEKENSGEGRVMSGEKEKKADGDILTVPSLTTNHSPLATAKPRHDSAALPRTQGLAGSDEPGGAVLRGDEEFPKGRTFRINEPDSQSGSVGASQHRGGAGTSAHEGIPELPERGEGIADGSRNTLASQSTSGPAQSINPGFAAHDVGGNQSDAIGPSTRAGEKSDEWRVTEKSGEWRVTSGEKEKSGEWRVTSGEKVASVPSLTTNHLPLTTSSVVIRVRDTGVGISPALLPHIFDLFTQADRSLDRSQGGLGIGLALVQQLTELHGGKVEAFSTLGEGSEFVVRLPVRSEEWRVTSGETQNASSLTTQHSTLATNLKVLVVDDNVDTVLGFSMLLKGSGHDVRTAHDGLSAVEKAIEYRPDVVLLDIGLPGLNGYEVAKRLRQNPNLKNTVLIALTGYGQDTDRQASQQAGFDHHLVKPARFDQLKKILATVQERLKL